MFINYKDKLYIYHPDGKFKEDELQKLLDAAYKAGYDKGYDNGYAAGRTYYQSYWEYRPYYVTTTDKTIDVTPHITCKSSGQDTLLKQNQNESISVTTPFVQTNITNDIPYKTTCACSCKE